MAEDLATWRDTSVVGAKKMSDSSASSECVVSEQLAIKEYDGHMAAIERRDHAASNKIKTDYMGNARFLGNPVDGNNKPPSLLPFTYRFDLS